MPFDPDKYLADKQADTFDPDAYLASKSPAQSQQEPSMLEALGRGAVQGATLGFGDELAGAGGAVVDKFSGSNSSLLDLYAKNRDEAREHNEAAKKAHPYAYLGGNVAGSIPTFMVGGEAGAIKNLPGVARAAVEAGTIAAGDSDADLTKGEVGRFAKDVGEGAMTGAALHQALGYVVPGAKKALSHFTGVPEQAIDAYAANPEAVNSARSIEGPGGIYEQINSERAARQAALDATSQQAATAEDAVKQAQSRAVGALGEEASGVKDEISGLKDRVSGDVSNAGFDYAGEKAQAQQAVNEAQQALDAAHAKQVEAMKSGVMHPTALVDEVLQAKHELQKAAFDLEAAATDKLADTGARVQTAPLLAKIEELMQKYGKGAENSVYPGELEEARSELKQLFKDVTELHNQALHEAQVGAGVNLNDIQAVQNPVDPSAVSLSARDARDVLKAINATLSLPGSGRLSYGSQAANEFRYFLRQQLIHASGGPQSEYAQLMNQAAHYTGLARDVNHVVKDPTAAFSLLNGVTKPGYAYKRQMLEALGDATNRDFGRPIDAFADVESKLSDKDFMGQMRDTLPEAQTLRDRQAALLNLSSPETRSLMLDSARASSPATPELEKAQEALDYLKNPDTAEIRTLDATTAERSALDAARAQQQQAQQSLEPFNGITENSLQGKLNAVKAGNKIAPEAQLDRVGQEMGQNFNEELHNLKVKQAFEAKDRTQGSKRTLMGATIGGAIGTVTGSPVVGAAVGGQIGAAMDRYGGPIAKAAVDSGLTVRRILESAPEKLGPYGPALASAMKRGPQAFAAAHFLLSQSDEGYRNKINEVTGQSEVR